MLTNQIGIDGVCARSKRSSISGLSNSVGLCRSNALANRSLKCPSVWLLCQTVPFTCLSSFVLKGWNCTFSLSNNYSDIRFCCAPGSLFLKVPSKNVYGISIVCISDFQWKHQSGLIIQWFKRFQPSWSNRFQQSATLTPKAPYGLPSQTWQSTLGYQMTRCAFPRVHKKLRELDT